MKISFMKIQILVLGGKYYYGIINSKEDEISKMATKYSVDQIEYYKALLIHIVETMLPENADNPDMESGNLHPFFCTGKKLKCLSKKVLLVAQKQQI